MLGEIEWIKYFILGVAAIATITDLFYGKIYNWTTVSSAFIGVLAGSYFLGWIGFGQSLLGIASALFLYGGLFGLRIMGGGDVKFLMALGALAGPLYATEVAILGVLIGGVLALLMLLFTGRLLGFIRRLYHFFITLVVKELEVEIPKVDKKFTMPFGIPLSIAAVWVAFSNPIHHFGVGLWHS